jgi:hypothetical protein
MATVADIPDGVTLQVPIQVTTDEGMVLQLVVDGDMVLGTGTEELDGDTVVYEVYSITQESFGNPETVEIEVGIDYDVPGPLGTATVKGTFAPLSTIQTMNASAPEPRFADTGEAKTFLEIGPCRTILLFPFVTNQAGFDTGIAIANTSADPMGTTNQAGVCKLNYYGNTNAGAAPAVQTSPSVPAGGHLVFALSGGGGVYAPNGGLTACAAGNCVAPLFQGYVFAICEFQFAHGYAFISDLGATKLAQGYLALVVPDRGDRLPQANSCGNGALSLGETDGTYECTDTNQGEQLNN